MSASPRIRIRKEAPIPVIRETTTQFGKPENLGGESSSTYFSFSLSYFFLEMEDVKLMIPTHRRVPLRCPLRSIDGLAS